MIKSLISGAKKAANDMIEQISIVKTVGLEINDRGEITSADVGKLLAAGVNIAGIASMFGIAAYIIEELAESDEPMSISLPWGRACDHCGSRISSDKCPNCGA